MEWDDDSAEIGVVGKIFRGVRIALSARGVPATLISIVICITVAAIFAPPAAFPLLVTVLSVIGVTLIGSSTNLETRRVQWEHTTQQWKDFYESNPGFLTKVVETNRAMTEAAIVVSEMQKDKDKPE